MYLRPTDHVVHAEKIGRKNCVFNLREKRAWHDNNLNSPFYTSKRGRNRKLLCFTITTTTTEAAAVIVTVFTCDVIR